MTRTTARVIVALAVSAGCQSAPSVDACVGACTSMDGSEDADAGTYDAYVPNDGACGLDATIPSGVRLVSPLSTTRTTTRRPRFRWTTTTGPALLEICSDRACTDVVASITASDAQAAPTSDLPVGVLFWRVTAGADASSVWEVRIPRRSSPVDTAWGSSLDLDGDGITDLVAWQSSRLLVYPGSSSGVPGHPATVLGPRAFPPEPDALVLGAPGNVGDVNGDGYADVGAVVASSALARVFFGGPSPISGDRSVVVAGLDPTALLTNVVGLGDVDADGYGDIAVMGYEYPAALVAAYFYSGGPAGPGCDAGATLVSPGAPFYLGTEAAQSSRVAAAGDVDGDGFADFVVTTLQASGGAGPSHLYRGSPSGPAAPVSLSFEGPADVTIPASAGDLNGDGYADVVIAITSDTMDESGRALVYMGSASGLPTSPSIVLDGAPVSMSGYDVQVTAIGAGDVDGDGYDDLAVGVCPWIETCVVRIYLGGATGIDAGRLITLTGAPYDPSGARDRFGATLAAGDLDGDGYADLSVGATGVAPVGAIYFLRGGATGLGALPSSTLVGPFSGLGAFGSALAE